ncbi:MAG: cell wall hydrolase [Aestuariivirga sp.]
MPSEDSRFWLFNHLPLAFAGLLLLIAVCFSGSMIGLNAQASITPDGANDDAVIAPTTELEGKVSLLSTDMTMGKVNFAALRRQTVDSDSKNDLVSAPVAVASAEPQALPPIPKEKPANMAKIAAAQRAIKIIPASYQTNADGEEVNTTATKRMVSDAPLVLVAPARQPFAATKSPVLQAVAINRMESAELTCLAKAVYFEARSESELGQLAVAKVILNRVKNPDFPKTICGVVYQGSEHRNSCQFSFACDGMANRVRSPEAWFRAKRIATRAMADDPAIRMLQAVNYHADYVTPRWAKTMKRLIRIGHHIFYGRYSDG